MSYTKYTKAQALTPGTTYSKMDALYTGSGNYTDGTVASDIGTPTIWWQGGTGQKSESGVVTWEDKLGDASAEAVSPSSGVTISAGTAATNSTDFTTFDGSNAYLKVDDYSRLDFNGAFEMMTLAYFDSGTGYQTIAAKDTVASAWQWVRKNNANNNVATFWMDGTDPIGATTLALDTWHILGVSRDSSNNVQLYLNGATDGSSVSNSTDLSGTDDFFMGTRWTGSAYTQEINGSIAEYLVWTGKSLSTAERASAVQYINDRYFNDPVVDFTVIKSDLTTEVKKLKRNTIVQIANKGISSGSGAGFTASDCIGLTR